MRFVIFWFLVAGHYGRLTPQLFHLPTCPNSRRHLSTLEGESLVNDGSGLLLYQIVILSASTANITLAKGGNLFLALTAIGIAVGALSGGGLSEAIRSCYISIHTAFPVAHATVRRLTFNTGWTSKSCVGNRVR
ncbi:cation:proton antiporter [Paraburkholderia sp. RL18-103-BIB-C]